ncbi:MAG: hypothetical protein KBD42_13610 [Chitinophagales bacterium]|jgi:hypothetical protein|nr:hypothetical protein [Chitinophagales bacterium]
MVENNNLILDSSFWNIYEKLTQEEAEEFCAFTKSELIDQTRHLGKFAEGILHFRNNIDENAAERLYNSVFEKKGFNVQVISNYLSDLKKVLLQFLQISWIMENENIKSWALSEMFLKKGLLRQFEKLNDDDLNDEQYQSPENSFFTFKKRLLKDEYAAALAKKREYGLLEPVIHDFQQYYLLETMRMYCELVNRKNLRSQDFDELQLQTFIQYFKNVQLVQDIDPLIELYYQIFNFLRDLNDEEAFKKYKLLLARLIKSMHPKTAREICLYGQNQCVNHINLNHTNWLAELFDLYNLMLMENIMYEGPYMTQYTFKNYVTVALRLKEFERAKDFVEVYQGRLHHDFKFNAYHYNLAAIYFEKNEFSEAMDELNKIQFTDPVYYLDSRSMLLKIYYADKDHDAISSLYNSVRVYLLRGKQLSKKQADLYRNLFLYTYKLSMLNINKKVLGNALYNERKQSLKTKVINASVANKNWLLEKINETMKE